MEKLKNWLDDVWDDFDVDQWNIQMANKILKEESRYLDKNHYHYLLSLRTYPIYQVALGVLLFHSNPWYDFDTTLVLAFPFPYCNTQYFVHRLSLILYVCVRTMSKNTQIFSSIGATNGFQSFRLPQEPLLVFPWCNLS